VDDVESVDDAIVDEQENEADAPESETLNGTAEETQDTAPGEDSNNESGEDEGDEGEGEDV
jgi:hypothetical protein